MATRKVSPPSDDSHKKSSEYVELKIPRLRFGTILVVGLLLIGAYYIGMQTAKVNYLEQKLNSTTPNTTTNPLVSPTPSKVDVEVGHLPVIGNKDAKVTIVEFSDFQCPFCKQLFDGALAQIKKEYVDTGKVKLAYRHYPLPIHPNAPITAEASECANEQGKFWEYHDNLFAKQAEWESQDAATIKTTLNTYAANLGLDQAQFSSCLDTGKFKAKVDEDTKIAQQVGVSATPTSYINGVPVVGALPYAAFKTILDEQLKK